MYKARTDCHCNTIYYGVLLVVLGCVKNIHHAYTLRKLLITSYEVICKIKLLITSCEVITRVSFEENREFNFLAENFQIDNVGASFIERTSWPSVLRVSREHSGESCKSLIFLSSEKKISLLLFRLIPSSRLLS